MEAELPCSPTPGTHGFGAVVRLSVADILADSNAWRVPLQTAFDSHCLLYWKDQVLSPVEEVQLMKLLDWDLTAPPDQLYGPLGKPGVDADIFRRWRIPDQPEVLLQGEGTVTDHCGLSGEISSGKPVLEWHSDGCYENDTPSRATSMYSISTKATGGATLFMSGLQIFEDLTEEEREIVSRLFVQYSRTPQPMSPGGYRASVPAAEDRGVGLGPLYARADFRNRKPDGSLHPFVWKVPSETVNRVAVQVSPMWVYRLIEMRPTGGQYEACEWEEETAQNFIERILSRGARSEYVHDWASNDLVVWDNRQLLHSASPNDTFSEKGTRLLHRIRLKATTRPESPAPVPRPSRQS